MSKAGDLLTLTREEKERLTFADLLWRERLMGMPSVANSPPTVSVYTVFFAALMQTLLTVARVRPVTREFAEIALTNAASEDRLVLLPTIKAQMMAGLQEGLDLTVHEIRTEAQYAAFEQKLRGVFTKHHPLLEFHLDNCSTLFKRHKRLDIGVLSTYFYDTVARNMGQGAVDNDLVLLMMQLVQEIGTPRNAVAVRM